MNASATKPRVLFVVDLAVVQPGVQLQQVESERLERQVSTANALCEVAQRGIGKRSLGEAEVLLNALEDLLEFVDVHVCSVVPMGDAHSWRIQGGVRDDEVVGIARHASNVAVSRGSVCSPEGVAA